MNARTYAAAAMCAAIPSIAACDDAAAPPTTVVVNTPPADTGQLVLLTVMVVAAFLALFAAGGFAWMWAQTRRALAEAERARREAEDAVLVLTGQPIDRVRLELRRQRPTAGGSRASDEARGEIEGSPR